MASPSDAALGKGSYVARLATFQQAHQLSKRRASSTGGGRKTKAKNVVEWPHQKPSGEDLARAGFFYRPSPDSNDNVQCYFCEVKLDGWEPEDDAIKEHLSHAPHCAWATCISAWKQDGEPEEARDPMSEAMVAARTFTFTLGDGWIHQNKRGWKCKIGRMVDAGWVFDPSPDTEDGVTCMHCNLSLDGWEPKDDPAEEHKKRSPDCQFFRLVERYHGAKSKKQGSARSSSASRTSRLSAQSVKSGLSDVPDLEDMRDSDLAAEIDDSIITTASTGTVKGSKKRGKSAKAGKVSKSEVLVPGQDTLAVSYPDPHTSQTDTTSGTQAEEQLTVKSTRSVRQNSNVPDSSAMISTAPKASMKRKGRKAKEERLETSEAEPVARSSDASAQLQEELDVSLGHATEPTPESPKQKRGVKRTSDGLRKESERDSSVATIEFPVPPQPAAKSKRVRKAQQLMDEETVAEGKIAPGKPLQRTESVVDSDGDLQMTQPVPAKAVKTKKVAAKKGKGKKTSSVRSSKAATTATSPGPNNYMAEDLARDEMEIEAELQRIAAEQASTIAAEQELDGEFEASPSHAQRHADRIRELELELQNEELAVPTPSLNMANFIATVAENPLPPPADEERELTTPSPSGSDKENHPSSVAQKPASPRPATWMGSQNTSRIPLAPGTPNRSPNKQALQSPSKHISNLSSSNPWVPIDLDAVLMASPQPTPNTLANRLANAAGVLRSPEKGLSVEGWIRYRAERGEEQLRQKCEEMVGAFEREGMRALRTLDGLVTS